MQRNRIQLRSRRGTDCSFSHRNQVSRDSIQWSRSIESDVRSARIRINIHTPKCIPNATRCHLTRSSSLLPRPVLLFLQPLLTHTRARILGPRLHDTRPRTPSPSRTCVSAAQARARLRSRSLEPRRVRWTTNERKRK